MPLGYDDSEPDVKAPEFADMRFATDLRFCYIMAHHSGQLVQEGLNLAVVAFDNDFDAAIIGHISDVPRYAVACCGTHGAVAESHPLDDAPDPGP